jgi:leucyl-tRNA synthetase
LENRPWANVRIPAHPTDAGEEQALSAARAEPNVARYLEGATLRKAIYVKGRIVNFEVG